MTEENGKTVVPLGVTVCPICHQKADTWRGYGRTEEVYVCENEHCDVMGITITREPKAMTMEAKNAAKETR